MTKVLPFTEDLGQSGKSFEDFCVRLAAREQGISWAIPKNKSGKFQGGVDVEGYSENNQPILVISCKRWKSATPANIKGWLRDFLQNWEGHWKDRGVQTFVLALTVEPEDSLSEAITEMSPQFERLGVNLVPWWPCALTDKAIPSPHQLILPFFNTETAKRVCGRDVQLDFQAFVERKFSLHQAAHGIAPKAKDYLDGTIYFPDELQEVENQLHEHRIALVLGAGASGKTVLGDIIASKKHRYKHDDDSNDANASSFAWTDYCAYLRLTPDSNLALVQQDLRRLADPKTLLIIDDIHLNTAISLGIYNKWQELKERPYILFLGRQSTSTKRARMPRPPIRLTADSKTVRGIYDYIGQTDNPNDFSPLDDKTFREWAKKFGDKADGKNVDLIALSHAIRFECEKPKNQRKWQLNFNVAADAIWKYYLNELSSVEIEHLILLSSIPDDMGLSGHALSFPLKQFKGSEDKGIVLCEVITRSETSEKRYRLSHSALGRLIWAAVSLQGLQLGDPHEIRKQIFEKDPLSGTIISLFETRTDETSIEESIANYILARDNVDWITIYKNRGGLDTIRAFIESCKTAKNLGSLLQKFLSHSAFQQLFLQAPLRNRSEFLATAGRVTNGIEDEKEKAAISALVRELSNLQFNDTNMSATLDQIRKERLNGIVRMFEISAKMRLGGVIPFERDIYDGIAWRAIDGEDCLNDFNTLFGSASSSPQIADLKEATRLALSTEDNIPKMLNKAHAAPAHMLAGFLQKMSGIIEQKVYALYAQELNTDAHADKIASNILREFQNGKVGSPKRLIYFINFLRESDSDNLRSLATKVVKHLQANENFSKHLLFSLKNTPFSYLCSFCKDVDAFRENGRQEKSDREFFSQLNVFEEAVKQCFSRESDHFFDSAIETQPLNELTSWFKEDIAGSCAKSGREKLFSELLCAKNIKILSERLVQEKQDIILSFLNNGKLDLVMKEVARLIKREDWHPRTTPKDTCADLKAKKLNKALDRLYAR